MSNDVPEAGLSERTLPLSKVVEADGLVFLSGQIAIVDGEVRGDIGQQTEQIFDAMESILASIGLNLDHVVKCAVWIVDPADFAVFNETYTKRFKAPYPARSCVISQFVLPNARVEIEAVAS